MLSGIQGGGKALFGQLIPYKFQAFGCCLFLFISLVNSDSWASNQKRELEFAEELESSFFIGEIVWLNANQKRFLTVYTETEETENVGTAIILHPMGGRPYQDKLINPIRTYLPEHNWATLSLQMPVLSIDAKEFEYYRLFDDANERIQAAVDYLILAGVKNIVLIGYGLGGTMALYYLYENSANVDVRAVVAISLGAPETDKQQMQVVDFIRTIKLPFLDIFTEHDVLAVTQTARKRRVAGKSNQLYRQFQIKGEGNAAMYYEGLVVKRVYSWINRVFR